ncbi:MAG: cytosine deaminase [Ignavibacteria bacterium]|nr:MAG: cytosine deaminase [Ignavibacteria bacterium]KAF0158353.1 MAG: cytosine deaminase [Ignavibacteria bacterium]
MLFSKDVYKYMYSALQEAEKALSKDEVPIGAVIVHNNKIIGRGFNQTETLKDATAHAEMIAITSAANYLGSKFLDTCDLYVTVEPCVMCAGAILLSRVKRIYFGSFEPKFGACGSLFDIINSGKYNRKPEVYSGIYSEESKSLLENFFKAKRNFN